MTNAPGKPSIARGPLAVAAVVVLAWAGWRSVTLGMAVFEAKSAPAAALEWRSGFPEAELTRAEASFRDRQTPAGDDDQIRAALRRAPLDARGYRILAREAELRRDSAEAAKLYGIAAALGPRDLPSMAWMAQYELERGEFAPALARFDQMMRAEPSIGLPLAPVLLNVAAHAPAQAEFAKVLSRSPPWREDFMPRLFMQAHSPAVFGLIERLRRGPGGLTDRELGMWLDRLAGERQWGTAYLTWVQSLTPEGSQRIGNIYNGSFELDSRNLGFDWRLESVPGARITRTQVTGAKDSVALRIEFEGRRVPFNRNVRQLLALAPGDYRLSGRMRLDDLRTDRGMVWNLTCFETGKLIAETEPMSGRREWSSFELKLSVPAQDCGGQWLTLLVPARIPAEQRIGGVAWFDDLKMKSD